MTTNRRLKRIFVTDFDGTISKTDFYTIAVERFLTDEDLKLWQAYYDGDVSHFTALASIFARLRAPEADILKILDDMGVDPAIPHTITRLREAGWEVIVASAGCRWYIERLLSNIQPPLTIHANEGTYDPAHGLLMTPPADQTFFDPATGTDKVGVVKDALNRTDEVIYAGDGRPDFAAAIMVPATNRFARKNSTLARLLDADGLGYHKYDDWNDIAEKLIFRDVANAELNGPKRQTNDWFH